MNYKPSYNLTYSTNLKSKTFVLDKIISLCKIWQTIFKLGSMILQYKKTLYMYLFKE